MVIMRFALRTISKKWFITVLMGDRKLCHGCKKKIEGSWNTAMGKYWHPEHFVCEHCKTKLEGTFNTHNDKPYCLDDYLKLFAHKCQACEEPIPGRSIIAFDAHWHPEHFVCQSCKTKLEGQEVMNHDKKPYCKNCHEKEFASRCAGCGRPVTGIILSTLNKQWHPNCFKCIKCALPIHNNMFGVDVNGKPICENCYSI